MKINIEIDNLTDAQALALEDLFATWQSLGGIGSSRWTAFFADGDGNFRPRILIDGKKPEVCTLTDRENRWRTIRYESEHGQRAQKMYMLDFDAIAWAMHDAAQSLKPKVDA